MNGELTAITVDDLRGLLNAPDPALIKYAEVSSSLHAGLFGDQRVCIIGLVTQSFLSDRAYVWFQVLESASKHGLQPASARQARRFVLGLLDKHPMLVGHCNTPIAHRWWSQLGATFTHIRDDIYQFEITK